MTDIRCHVENCIFNEDSYCTEGDITIGDTGECWTAELKESEEANG